MDKKELKELQLKVFQSRTDQLPENFDYEKWSKQYDSYPEMATAVSVLFVLTQTIKSYSEK